MMASARVIPDFEQLQKQHKHFEIERKIKEMSVLESELTSMRNTSKVYKQQPNSLVYFKSEKDKCMKECKADVKNLKHDLQELERNSLS